MFRIQKHVQSIGKTLIHEYRFVHTVVLLRHGESLWNKEERFTGWSDVPLTEAGEAGSSFIALWEIF